MIKDVLATANEIKEQYFLMKKKRTPDLKYRLSSMQDLFLMFRLWE